MAKNDEEDFEEENSDEEQEEIEESLEDEEVVDEDEGEEERDSVGKLSDGKNIINTEISEEVKKSYLDYAMSVIVARALPSIEDGLKPVQRRILYSMDLLSLQSNKQTKEICENRRRCSW